MTTKEQKHSWYLANKHKRKPSMPKSPEIQRRHTVRYLMKKLGSNESLYYQLSELGCGICGAKESKALGKQGRLCIDHDHSTGLFRGVLCWGCNIALGHMRDDTVLLQRAISYLENSGSKKTKETI